MTFQGGGKDFGVNPGSEQQEGSVSINAAFGQEKKVVLGEVFSSFGEGRAQQSTGTSCISASLEWISPWSSSFPNKTGFVLKPDPNSSKREKNPTTGKRKEAEAAFSKAARSLRGP